MEAGNATDFEEQENVHLFKFFFEGLLMVSLGSGGVLGNILCVFIFSRESLQRSFHHLMVTLAMFDILYIVMALLLFCLPELYPGVRGHRWYAELVPVLLPLAQIGLTGSIYLTLAIAIERYTTVCHPFFKVSHSWSSRHYILPICLFSGIYNIPKFFELKACTKYHYHDNDTFPINSSCNSVAESNSSSVDPIGEYTIVIGTRLRTSETYYRVYVIYMNLFVNGVIPLLSLVILNSLIYHKLRHVSRCIPKNQRGQSMRQREVQLARVSCIIVGVFILCHSVRWVPNIHELLWTHKVWPDWIAQVTSVSHLLTVFSASVNFYVYSAKHRSSIRQTMRRAMAPESFRVEQVQDLETAFTSCAASKKTSLAQI